MKATDPVPRRLGPDDVEAALVVLERFHGVTLAEPYVRSLLTDPVHVLLVVEVEGRPAGFVWAHWLPRLRMERRHLFVYEVEVAPEHRRKGLGAALMRRLLAETEREGADLFLLTNRSNEVAVAFYESLGATRKNDDDLLFSFPASPRS